MTEFQAFLKANMTAQANLRAKILNYDRSPPEYGRRSKELLQTDLLALTVELNIRYMQEKIP
jgi:hypothetical protein